MNNQQDFQDGTESSTRTGRFVNIAPKTHPMRGKLVERVGPDDPGGIKRVHNKKDGTSIEVYEKPYSSITGTIIGLYLRERDVDFGQGPEKMHSAILVLDVAGERMSIEISQSTRHWTPFCMALPNVDLAKKVRIETWDYDQRGTNARKAGLSFKQMAIGEIPAGAKVDEKSGAYQVPWYWTKEKPGKLPPAVSETSRTGKVTWYFDERDQYLREVVIPAIAKRIEDHNDLEMAGQESAQPAPKAAPAQAAQPAPRAQQVAKAPAPAPPDDLDDGLSHAFDDMGDDSEDLPF